MKKNNRTCIVCGTQYTYCNNCAEHMKNPTWMTIYHNENCKNIFAITSDYLNNITDKDATKERLDNCDLSYKDKLHNKIAQVINEIYVTEDNTIAVIEEITEEVTEEKVIKEAKPKAKKKNLNSDYNERV